MKLIDEKIKALGLTKGQYCEKYGFKFKDFAAKVHTLEAKIEWANTFLKPLGLSLNIRDNDLFKCWVCKDTGVKNNGDHCYECELEDDPDSLL